MPKRTITIEYEVTHSISKTVEVDEEDIQKIMAVGDLDVLEKYDVTSDIMWESCMDDGWAECDYSVSDEDEEVLIPWANH